MTQHLLTLAAIAAWLTAIVNSVMTSNVTMLIVDLVFFPVAIIHGIGIWFGVW